MNMRSAQPTSPQLPAAGDVAPPQTAGEDALERRRRLLRAAVAGAPLVLGVSPAGAIAARGSAYRAAENDATASLSASGYGTGDTWTRVQVDFGRIVRFSDDSDNINEAETKENIYKIGMRYFQTSGIASTAEGVEVLLEPNSAGKLDAFVMTERRSVLVLFHNDSFTEAGFWPQAAVGDGIQALHCSSWSSINPGAGSAYSCAGS